MTDLVSDSSNTQSPKRKFSFRFPHLAQQSTSLDKDSMGANGSNGNKTAAAMAGSANRARNFCEEIKNVPDLQVRLKTEISYSMKTSMFIPSFLFILRSNRTFFLVICFILRSTKLKTPTVVVDLFKFLVVIIDF